MERRSVRIDLGYDGRMFHGSQRQSRLRTVQSELEAAIEQITGEPRRFALAGRTDKGVHATGQVASGEVRWAKDLERLRYGLDSVSGDDLVIYDVSESSADFHARFSARCREYRYRVYVSMLPPVILRGKVWWLRPPIELQRMNRASAQFIGSKDFRSFAGSGLGTEQSDDVAVRDVDLAEWREIPDHLERSGKLFEFRVRANAFLPHMVRNMTGALIDIGRGARPESWIDELIETQDRRAASPPAPPEGLTLWEVVYEKRKFEVEPGHEAGLEQE